jgi:plasmid stabilization system protein ParE
MNGENSLSYRILIQSEAEAEITEAFQWYESKAQGLGAEFIRALDAGFAVIERDPTTYHTVYKQVRRVLLRRFPYGLFYVIEEQMIVVVACFHASRDPKQWQRRV